MILSCHSDKLFNHVGAFLREVHLQPPVIHCNMSANRERGTGNFRKKYNKIYNINIYFFFSSANWVFNRKPHVHNAWPLKDKRFSHHPDPTDPTNNYWAQQLCLQRYRHIYENAVHIEHNPSSDWWFASPAIIDIHSINDKEIMMYRNICVIRNEARC